MTLYGHVDEEVERVGPFDRFRDVGSLERLSLGRLGNQIRPAGELRYEQLARAREDDGRCKTGREVDDYK